MEAADQRKLVEAYLKAYNQFDVDAMLNCLHDDITFRNIADGAVTLATAGKEAFRQQAEAAKQYFSQREQRPTAWAMAPAQVEVLIDYRGVAAVELPKGVKPGENLQLPGKSIFQFQDGKISSVKGIS